MPTFDELWPPNAAPAFGPWAHPYYIWVNPYRESSAGIRVLYYLCHILNSMGYEAYVTSDNAPQELRAPPLTSEIVNRHRALGRESIAVIPESIRGDLFESRVAVRYLLNHPGLVNRDFHFSPWELTFTWADEHVPAGIDSEKLFIPTSDPALFRSDGVNPSERTLVAYYANRILQTDEPLQALPANAIELSPRVRQRSLRELADLFRRCKVLYSYEFSAICYEAMLCGCPVALVPNRYLASQRMPLSNAPADQLPYFELHEGYGICLGIEEGQIEAAKANLNKFREVYHRKASEALAELKNFVRITQEFAERMALTRWRLPRNESRLGPAPPSDSDSPPSVISPAVLLHAQFKEFCAQAATGDWRGATYTAEQLDSLLDLLTQGIGQRSGAMRSAADTMLKMSGVSFLQARYILTVQHDPVASLPFFRLAAHLCIMSVNRSPSRRPDMESLHANALIHECFALARAGASDEKKQRLAELNAMRWTDPVAKKLAESGLAVLGRALDEDALYPIVSTNP